jgi:transposase
MSHHVRPNPVSALHTLVPQALILQEDVQPFHGYNVWGWSHHVRPNTKLHSRVEYGCCAPPLDGEKMMGKVTCAAPHLSIDEVKGKLRTSGDFWLHQKWSVIYTALVDPRPAATIALHLGVSVPFVHKIISLYKRFGPAVLATPGSGGRRNQYLTIEEEQQFIAPFLQHAATGEMATIRAIKSAFEAYVHHPVHKTAIYRLLYRHGWRKIAPRARHPAATPDTQDAFKKTFLQPSKQPCKPARPMIRARS